MKSYLQAILLIVLTLSFSGCTKNSLNFKNIDLPSFQLPKFSKERIDNTLPIVKNLRYKASMTEVVLKWDQVHHPSVAGYRILRYSPKRKSYIVIDKVTDPVSTHYVDSNLKYNTTYLYRVSCYTKDGKISLASEPVQARTKYKLIPIKDLKAISNLPKKVKLEWKPYPMYSKIKYYSVQKSYNGSTNWQEIARLKDQLAVEYIDYDVKPAKVYFYRVVAYTFDDIPSPSSNVVSGYAKQLPLPPINITATQNQPRKIKVAWFDPNKKNKIVQYNIYTSLFKDTLFIKHASTPNKFYIDKVNEDGKVVYYKITAVDIDGLESPLPKKAVKAMTKPNSSAPTITEYKLVDNRVIIKWLPPARDVKEYVVIKRYYNKFFLPKKLKIKGFKTTTFVDKDIKVGKTYTYQVIGIDSDGVETKPSKSISITIK